MPPPARPTSDPPSQPPPPQSLRQPGWVVLCGMTGLACLMIGLMMFAMIQAPAVRHRVIVTSLAFIAAGLLLVPVAWLKRARRPSPSAAEHRAQELDRHGQTPT